MPGLTVYLTATAVLTTLRPAIGFVTPHQLWQSSWSLPSNSRGGARALCMKIQWDPYTGQFIDTGGDQPAEFGVPSRTPPPGKKSSPPPQPQQEQQQPRAAEVEEGVATGVRADMQDAKSAQASFGKAAAYMAAKKSQSGKIQDDTEEDEEEELLSPEEQALRAIDQMIEDALGPSDRKTWPELNDNMMAVLKTEQAANLDNMLRTLDLARATVALCAPKDGPLVQKVDEALRNKGAAVKKVVGDKAATPAALKDVTVVIMMPSGEAGGLLKFAGGEPVLESHQVDALLTNAASHGVLKHVVYVSALGTEKTGFQFSLDGIVEKKKAVEQSVRRLAKSLGYSWSIIRVGQLTPGKSGEKGMALEPGDALTGSTSLPLLTDALVQSLVLPYALNASYALVSTNGPAPTEEDWRDNMVKLVGPEVLRIPLKHVDPGDAQSVLRAWALQFMEGSRKLTTPVFAVRSPAGVKIYFMPKTKQLGPSFSEERAIQKARMKGDAGPSGGSSKKSILEGGLEVCVDEKPVRRVRVRRIAMDEGTVVKAMSERDLLNSLREEVERIEKEAQANGGRLKFGGNVNLS